MRRGSGRPTRDQAEARHAELLDTALDIFLERGFELTTMEGVAAAAGMTKRTIYARYDDKAALFRATVLRAIDRTTVSLAAYQACEADDIEATMIAFAQMRVAHLQTAQGQKLQRIINTESYRFPEIFQWYYEKAAGPAIEFLVDLLGRHQSTGAICVGDLVMAANAFMSLVIGGPVRMIGSGNAISEAEIAARITFAVRLFLNGARGANNRGERQR